MIKKNNVVYLTKDDIKNIAPGFRADMFQQLIKEQIDGKYYYSFFQIEEFFKNKIKYLEYRTNTYKILLENIEKGVDNI